jgi:hypothetical protein
LAERINVPLGVLISRVLAITAPLLSQSFNRDHSSIIHGVKAINGRMEAEPAFRLTIRRIEHDLGLFSQAGFHEYREHSSGC